MRIFICEKPSQARDIAGVLGVRTKGDGYLACGDAAVTWCYGHLLEMCPPEAYSEGYKQWTLHSLPILPGEWKLEVKREGAKQFKAIKQLLRQGTEVVIATDADREGETIGREVLQACGWRGPVQRLWLSALDPASIKKALAQILPGERTAALYSAGLGRARADWLVGMNLTRAYTLLGRDRGVEGVLSVGRVQTPTLRLVVDRDRQIEGFVAQPFWDVVAVVQRPAVPEPFKMKWKPTGAVVDAEGRCINEQAARNLAQQLRGAPGRVTLAQVERKSELPPLPYKLSVLQQDASRLFGLDADKTLEIAQALYETYKATTYPRTDCQYLPESQFEEAPAILQAMMSFDGSIATIVQAAKLTLKSRAWNDAKITAHHGIIPTAARVNLSEMNEMERKVYDLIRRRYIAQFYPDYQFDQARIEAQFGSVLLGATGRTPAAVGWRGVFNLPDEEDEQVRVVLPQLAQGDGLQCLQVDVEAKKTQPPARYTDGTLIQAMESVGRHVADERLRRILKETAGIGTEATRASIIKTLVGRGYIERTGKKKHLISTPKARLLIDALPDPVKDPATTALWEQALEEIAQGRGSLEAFLERQAAWVGQLVSGARSDGATRLLASPEAAKAIAQTRECPTCGKPMRKRSGSRGEFWGCTGYPDCKATAEVEGKSSGSSAKPRAKRSARGR
ncbi:DNA topoisomerase III [Solimonas sp. SE-A11]|uniref:DNA topoisomerase III n=1 Tax=Solimonas sp. SE-A11 TaxID=3054954 RepID=UPI00259CA9B0|nr:DNA topoisomerase III [Solimonas sp. SE-A11]MDM4770869.1 DNA topoisomerase III [Solimonas sp. SE-A11]